MGEEVRTSDYEGTVGGKDEERMSEWEIGLPSADDLTPLCQILISSDLASAFNISPEPYRTVNDVNRASRNTLSSIRRQSQAFLSDNLKSFPSMDEDQSSDPLVVEGVENDPASSTKDGSDARKIRRLDNAEEADSAMRTENSIDDQSAKTLKRSRLVWTAQLHKRFVDVVAHVGIENAVPKTIMQLMNVEGLTRENVASHLQKYRLYLKRMQSSTNEGPSPSDHLFASTPVPQSLQESGGNGQMPHPMPYAAQMVHMPVIGVAHGHGHGHVGMPQATPAYHGFQSHPFNMYRGQQQN